MVLISAGLSQVPDLLMRAGPPAERFSYCWWGVDAAEATAALLAPA